MTARSVIEHALTAYYADSQQADQVVRVLLHNYNHDHRTAVLAEDGQAYDGELTMLRVLARTLRVAARHGDLPAMQQALIHHASDDAEAREKSSRPTADATPDTLPAWLYQRFAVIHGAPPWDRLTDSDRSYWEHQARAVRRAVARGGFKTEAGEPT